MATIQRQQTASRGSVTGLLNEPLPGLLNVDGLARIMKS
jgi:hypothetical protein